MHNDESRLGGNGPLDSSWLNARSSDTTGKGMDQEVWADARTLVERLDAKKNAKQPDEGEDMEVDTNDS